MNDFHGLPTAVLENEYLRLEYLASAGPRIVGLSLRGSPNLLADVHDLVVDAPFGKYSFRGGHRLWIAPEVPEKTNIPDDSGLQVRSFPGGVELTGASEPGSGVRKSIRLQLEADRPAVTLTHTVVNENPVPFALAPWAITQFRLGGTVILPQPFGNTDPHGLLSNRLLVLWPYTRLHDPRLALRDDYILVHAGSALPPLKLGYASAAGWMAYWNEGILFRKSFDLHPGALHPDHGCNAETYCGDRFVELETLGVLDTLAPGQKVEHTETWDFFTTLDVPFLSPAIQQELKKK